MVIVSHCPYLPDLAPWNFFLYPWMKQDLKRHIADVAEAQWEWLAALDRICTEDNLSSSGGSAGITASTHRAVLWSRPKFQTCTNILNTYFVTVLEIFGSPLISTYVNTQYRSICLKMFRLFSDILQWLKRQNLSLVIQILNELLGLAPTTNTTFFCKINIFLMSHNFQLCTHLIKRILPGEFVTNYWTKNCIHPKFNAYYELLI